MCGHPTPVTEHTFCAQLRAPQCWRHSGGQDDCSPALLGLTVQEGGQAIPRQWQLRLGRAGLWEPREGVLEEVQASENLQEEVRY